MIVVVRVRGLGPCDRQTAVRAFHLPHQDRDIPRLLNSPTYRKTGMDETCLLGTPQ